MKQRSKRYVGFSEYSFVSKRGKPAVTPPLEVAVPSLKRFPQAEALLESEARTERDLEGGEVAAGRVVAKRYALEERVGEGGMGEVWSAYDRKLGRRVALKLVDLVAADQPSAHARFIREATLARQLHGPAFAEVHDYGFVGDRAFLVMDLLDGESLLERLRRVGRLNCEESLALAQGLAEALRVAHALQIVHRDLKPSNIFFAREKASSSGVQALRDACEVIKLLDFGVAKSVWDDARLTRPDMLVGSAMYMSPEQIVSGRDVDTRADLWSLAVVLYRALTGRRPFEGKGGEVLARIARDAAPAPSRLLPSLPRGLDAFFVRALAKDPRARFATVDELLGAFEQALSRASWKLVPPLPLDSADGRETIAHAQVPSPIALPAAPPHAAPEEALAGVDCAPADPERAAHVLVAQEATVAATAAVRCPPPAAPRGGARRAVMLGAAVAVGAALGAALADGRGAELVDALEALLDP